MPVTLPAPSTLEDVFKMNPGAFGQAQGMIDLGMQQGQQDLRKTQLQNLFDEQNDPLRVEQTRLANETSLAQLPGFQADSAMKQRKNSNEALWNDDAVKAARSEFLAKASDNDLKMIENKAQEMAYSFDPKVRAQGEALLNMHKDMVKERSKQADMGKRRLDEIKESGNQARLTQQQAIDAGKFKKAGKDAQDALEKALVSGSWDKAATAYDAMAQRAQQSGDMEAAMYYQEKSQEYANKWLLSRQAPKPGQVDTGAVTGLPTNPQPQVPTPALPVSPVDRARRETLQDLQTGAQFSSPEVEARVRNFAGQRGLDPRNSNIPSDLPQGTRINPDGTFTLPDGTRIRKKAQ